MSLLEYDIDGQSFKSFSIKTYNTYINKFEDIRLDNALETVVERYYGDEEEEGVVLHEAGPEGTTFRKYIWDLDDQQLSFRLLRSVDSGETWKETVAGRFSKSSD